MLPTRARVTDRAPQRLACSDLAEAGVMQSLRLLGEYGLTASVHASAARSRASKNRVSRHASRA